ncbi:unnamed protein product [Adineta steineri]|uniref:Uncharacterized protein n=1 Tax=Adineta steineri TaxID=433720 RepID=A0A815E1L8_9BILA|nr:unnamed protein product [Adineta steineri]CAF1305559.1 unnamed protein product [Adineta steineri]
MFEMNEQEQNYEQSNSTTSLHNADQYHYPVATTSSSVDYSPSTQTFVLSSSTTVFQSLLSPQENQNNFSEQ